MNYWCAKCGGVFDPATLQSITGYLCTCPKEQTSASNNSIPMTPETPSLTPFCEQYKQTIEINDHISYCLDFEDAQTLETRALSAEAELAATQALIARSNLEEVDGYMLDPKDCKPTFMKSGKRILRDKETLSREQQIAVNLRKHAATARKLAGAEADNARLRGVLERCRISMLWSKDVIAMHLGESIRGASKQGFDELESVVKEAAAILSKPLAG